MPQGRILVVDDEIEILNLICRLLEKEGYEVMTAQDGSGAIELIRDNRFNAVLLDLRLPDSNGIDVLKHIKKNDPDTIGIVLTGYGTIESAVEAMHAGAFHYLTKPFKLSTVRSLLEKAMGQQRAKEKKPEADADSVYLMGDIVGQSDVMKKLFKLVNKVVESDSTVLISGESGTGKELVARALHNNGLRQNGSFIPVNCSAIPEGLLESELFGHEKGAFTGANTIRIGRFELANNGTIFLDEVGSMSPAMQVKILRVLQEHRFERLGGVKTITTNVRVMAATNIDLEEAVELGEFREDLYYRLDVIPIKLPPLREREGDIPLLVSHFLKIFNALEKKNVGGFSFEALSLMERYSWPGNVRELENIIDRMVVLKGEGIIVPNDLPEKLCTDKRSLQYTVPDIPEDGLSLDEMINSIEKELILKALERSNWVKQKAAQLLNVNRTTLVEKIKKKGLTQ